MAAKKRPAHPGKKRADAERKHLVPEYVDAHDAGGDFIVAYTAQYVAVIAENKPHQHNEREEHPSVAYEKRGVRGYALDAQGTVGDGGGVDDEHPDDLGETERGYAEVVIPKPQHGNGDKKGKYGGDYSAGQHRRPEGREQLGEGPDYGFKNPHHFLLFRRQNAQSRNIGPHGNETGMPQGEKTCEPIDEVERKRQDGVDENELGDVNLVVAKKKFRLPYRAAHQGHGQYAQDRAAVQAHQIFSSVRSPSRPVGL